MSKAFIIGERTRNEWVAVYEKENEILKFCHTIEEAKHYPTREEALKELDDLRQTTGSFGELQTYLLEDGVAYIIGERDSYHPVNI